MSICGHHGVSQPSQKYMLSLDIMEFARILASTMLASSAHGSENAVKPPSRFAMCSSNLSEDVHATVCYVLLAWRLVSRGFGLRFGGREWQFPVAGFGLCGAIRFRGGDG